MSFARIYDYDTVSHALKDQILVVTVRYFTFSSTLLHSRLKNQVSLRTIKCTMTERVKLT